MDEVIKEAIKGYGAKIVELEDRFEFHCTQCGKCCTNREDILLTPRDLFRAAKELNMAVKDFSQSTARSISATTHGFPSYA